MRRKAHDREEKGLPKSESKTGESVEVTSRRGIKGGDGGYERKVKTYGKGGASLPGDLNPDTASAPYRITRYL